MNDTKQKILTAAQELFATHGFAGASMGKIAKLAGVTHSLLFHHFGNKQQLWVAVKQGIVDQAKSQRPTLPSTSLSFDRFLDELFHNMLSFYRENPDIVRMIGWQRLQQSINDQQAKMLTDEAHAWIMAFEHYHTTGELKADIPPNFAVAMVLSLISHIGLDHAPVIKAVEEQHYIQFCIGQLKSSWMT